MQRTTIRKPRPGKRVPGASWVTRRRVIFGEYGFTKYKLDGFRTVYSQAKSYFEEHGTEGNSFFCQYFRLRIEQFEKFRGRSQWL